MRIIVGFPPGGAADIVARVIAQWLSDRLGQPFVVENRPGAGTNVATEAVLRAAPDGHTLLFVSVSNAINTTLYDKLNFDFVRDIAPVASVDRLTYVMVVNPSVPVNTVSELIAYAKSNPGKLNIAVAAVGSGTHLSGELFKAMTGVNLVNVPYTGSPLAFADLFAGQVQVMFDALATSVEHIKAGKLRALGVTTAKRSELLPDIPTIAETVPRIRGKRVARHRRAQEHTRRNYRQAQQGDQCGPCRSQDQDAAGRAGRCSTFALSG